MFVVPTPIWHGNRYYAVTVWIKATEVKLLRDTAAQL